MPRKLNIEEIRRKAAAGTTQPLPMDEKRGLSKAEQKRRGLRQIDIDRARVTAEMDAMQAAYGSWLRSRIDPNHNPGGPPW